jgi:hypothetical protein
MALIPSEIIFLAVANGRVRSLFVHKPFQSRAVAMSSLLVEALAGIKVADQRFLINIGDRPRRERLLPPWRIFGPAQAEGCRDIAAPDFVFGGWPETGVADYDATCARIAAAGTAPPEPI